MSRFVKSLFASSLLVFVFCGGARAESALASIDWSTFTWQLYSIGGTGSTSLTWGSNSLNSGVNASAETYAQDGGADWTSSFGVTSGAAFASATAASLSAGFSSVPSSSGSYASAWRNATFTLSDQTMAVFSVNASASIDMAVPLGGAGYAWAYLTADGGDMFGGADVQHSQTDKITWAQGAGNPLTASGKLFVSFSNLSGADLTGTISGNTNVNSYGATIVVVPEVPEPENYAMFLAGLVVMGSIAIRRKRSRTDA